MEKSEAIRLPAEFGKQYSPHSTPSLSSDTFIERRGTTFVNLHGESLAIHPDSGSWAFLTSSEAALLERTISTRMSDLGSPSPDRDAFVAHLYQRGLISLNGHRAVDSRMFADSGNYTEGHLVELLLTEKCNLNCGYCLAGANPNMPVMTPEIARRTVDLAFAMREAAVLGFEFSGGEPFLKFDLMRDLTRYILEHPLRNARRVYISVQSNGTLLNQERVEWLKSNHVSIGISFDGQPWSQNVSRPMLNGKESFRQLIRGIDLLQRASIHFGALVVLNRSNIGSVADLLDFLLDNDVRSFKLNPISFLGAARSNWHNLGLTQAEVIGYFQELISALAQRQFPLLEANLAAMLRFLTSKQRSTRCLRSHCGAGDNFQAISAAGDIYPCGRSTQTPALRLGNVLDVSIASLSEPARTNPYVIAIRERRPNTLDACQTCEYREFCQAGCSAQAMEKYGTVRHRTPECDFFKTLYPHLMYKLSFHEGAFEAFRRIGYFGPDGKLTNVEYSVN